MPVVAPKRPGAGSKHPKKKIRLHKIHPPRAIGHGATRAT